MQLRIEFQYTFDDLFAAQKAHAKGGKPDSRGSGKLLGWLLFVLLAILLYVVLQNQKPGRPAPPPKAMTLAEWFAAYAWWVVGGLVVVLLVVAYFSLKRVARKRFERDPVWHQLQTVDLGPDGMTRATHTASVAYKWDAFRRYVETPGLFMLYVSESSYEVLPKRAFRDAAEIERFREFLGRVISPPPGGFPVLPPTP